MTIENRRFIALDEITAIQYRCKKCGTTVTVPRERWGDPVRNCPGGCSEDAVRLTPLIPAGTSEDKAMKSLQAAVKDLSQSGGNCQIMLELRQTDDE